MPASVYARSQKYIEEENQNYHRRSPPRSAKKLPLYVASNFEDTLARPLSPGLRYAAEVADFDELAERHVWELSPEEQPHITQSQVSAIFRAKCIDQRCRFTFDRAQRFNELMFQKCRGEWCILRQCGLGLESLRSIVDMLVHDHNITHLDLSGNTFGPACGSDLSRLLDLNDTLIVLRLQSVNIGEGVIPAMDALARNKYLTALDLSGIPGITRNTIWGESAASVAHMMANNQVLSFLNLAHCGLQKSAAAITRACAVHASLTRLDLSGNKIKDEGCRAVGELLSKGVCALLSLSLEENQISCAGATILGDALKSSESVAANSLEQLHLGLNSIGGHGLSALASAFREHHAIQIISLHKNKLCSMGVDEDGYRLPDSTEGLAALFSAIEFSKSIQSVKLSDCNIRRLPSNIFLALAKTDSLQRLEIAENRFEDDGGAALAEGLAKNRSLTYLDCTQCGMNESMAALASALAVHPVLAQIKINQGCWDLHGSGIIDALKQSHSIVSVDLGKDAMDYLRGALSRNKQLRVQNATPQLIEKQRELAEEEKELQQTQEFIVDEIKSRERAMEQLKVLRERQKVAAQQMKEELEALKAAVDEGLKKQDRLGAQAQAAEDDFNAKARECDNERNKILKRTESATAAKQEAIVQAQRLMRQHPHLFPNAPGLPKDAAVAVDFEVQKLQMELRVAQSDMEDHRSTAEALKVTLEELLGAITALSKPQPATTPTAPPKKK